MTGAAAIPLSSLLGCQSMGFKRRSNLAERASFHLRKMVQATITKPTEHATAIRTVRVVPDLEDAPEGALLLEVDAGAAAVASTYSVRGPSSPSSTITTLRDAVGVDVGVDEVGSSVVEELELLLLVFVSPYIATKVNLGLKRKVQWAHPKEIRKEPSSS